MNARAEFEPKIPASDRPQNHALGRGATGIGWKEILYGLFNDTVNSSACVASDLRIDGEYSIGRDIEESIHGKTFWY
jgi:hypothetical protein